MATASISEEEVGASALRRVTWRLIPFLFMLYVVAYLDRVNVGFAALQMKAHLHLSEQVYGFGAGIFFVGYFLFEVPSNLILARVGARKWIARIMFTWGIISCSMMFARGAASFYVLRFLLGLAEAGFFPGMILYLTYWFPAAERAKAVARFMTATALSSVIGGPVSGLLLGWNGIGGLRGWQWLFLVEGIPALILGVAVLFYLTDRPEQAHWLPAEEREWLVDRLSRERVAREEHGAAALIDALRDPRVALLSLVYFCNVIAMYGTTLWAPQVIKARSGWGNATVGWAVAIPYLAAAITMTLVGSSSDRTRERRRHLCGSAVVGAVGFLIAALTGNPLVTVFGLALSVSGICSVMGPFWALPTAFLCGAGAAGGIAAINSVGNLGGFVGPYLMGLFKGATGAYTWGLLTLGASLLVCGLLALGVKSPDRLHP